MQLFYYQEPEYKLLSENETPANIPTELLIAVKIRQEDIQNLQKYG